MILRGWGVFVTDRWSDWQTDICDSRVAFATENLFAFQIHNVKIETFPKRINQIIWNWYFLVMVSIYSFSYMLQNNILEIVISHWLLVQFLRNRIWLFFKVFFFFFRNRIWAKSTSPNEQESAQFPHPDAVEHHGTPSFSTEVHLKYSVPLYVKGNLQDSPFVVKQPENW